GRKRRANLRGLDRRVHRRTHDPSRQGGRGRSQPRVRHHDALRRTGGEGAGRARVASSRSTAEGSTRDPLGAKGASLLELVEAVRALPYGRQQDRSVEGLLQERRGTCSTKHLFLARPLTNAIRRRGRRSCTVSTVRVATKSASFTAIGSRPPC